ncbi:MAG: site-specific DNA-methyltransferase [Alphaproteobacteria bacterium]|nr:site-specific DNA-methyltransferase [Alphaproteobacteria bacterium]
MIDLQIGDCLNLMKALPENSIDATITSPPYDSLRTYEGVCTWGESQWKEALNQLYRVTKKGGIVVWIVNDMCIKGSESGTSFKQALYAKEIGFRLHDTMIWHKNSGGFTTHHNRYTQTFEYMFVFSKGAPQTHNIIKDKKNKWAGSKGCASIRQPDGATRKQKTRHLIKEYGARYNIWEINPVQSNTERTGHPAQFPIKLAHDHILTWTNKGDTVLDPFMGSGTTAVACIKTNRNFIGMEMNENYYKLAQNRIESEMGCSL